MSIRLKFALATIALAATAGANATSFASASVGPIQIQLFDLNPYDSVLPSIVFTNADNSYISAYASNSQTANYINTAGTATSGTASITASNSGATATSLQGAQSSISGQVSGGTGGTNASFYGYVIAPYYSSFTLSANTAVRFSTVATVTAGTTVGYSQIPYGYESASSSVSLWANGYSGSSSQSGSDGISAYANYTPSWSYDPATGNYNVTYSGNQNSTTQTLFVGLANFSSSSMNGSVSAQTFVNGNSSIAAAVPEPETYAMLLAGLGLMGAVVRRRRARSL